MEALDENVRERLVKLETYYEDQVKLKEDFENQQNMLVHLLSNLETFYENVEFRMNDLENKLDASNSQHEVLRKELEYTRNQNKQTNYRVPLSIRSNEHFPAMQTKPHGKTYSEVTKSCSDATQIDVDKKGKGVESKVFTNDFKDTLSAFSLISPPKKSKEKRLSNISNNSETLFESDEEDTSINVSIDEQSKYQDIEAPNNSLQCDICSEICRRAVRLGCCSGQACNECAVKFKMSKKANERICWSCGRKAVSYNLLHHSELRDRVKLFRQTNKENIKKEVE